MDRQDYEDIRRDEATIQHFEVFWNNNACFAEEISPFDMLNASTPEEYAKIGRLVCEIYLADRAESDL